MASKLNQSTHVPQSGSDLVQQLFNGGQVGPKSEMECDFSQVNQILGVRLRLYPASYRPSPLIPEVPANATELYEAVAKNWLDRHPLLNRAEVRDLGDAMDVILWLESPINIAGNRQRHAFAGLTKVIQSILPINPRHLSINATTGAIGSVDSSTGHKVSRIRQGAPLTKDELVGAYVGMAARPFKTVMHVTTGQDRVDPCPLCNTDGSSLEAWGDHGFCDGGCGEVILEQLYDLFFIETKPNSPRTTSETKSKNQSKGALLAARFEKGRRRVREYWPTPANRPRPKGFRDIRANATLEREFDRE